jgi:hypothetical protein
MTTCKLCSLPLSAVEREQYNLALKSNAHTLECKDCASLCYHILRSKDPPPKSGHGLCKKCGGTNSNIKPKALLKLSDAGEIWSCPVHETKHIDDLNNTSYCII